MIRTFIASCLLAVMVAGLGFLGYVEFMARYRLAFGDCAIMRPLDE